MVELNQNKHWKQQDQPDAVWKPHFTLEIIEYLPHPFNLAKNRIYLDTHLKEELTEQTAPVFPIPTGRVKSGWWTL